jgi:hypothetical protein
MPKYDAELLAVSDVREFFRDALAIALEQQHLRVKDHTEHYVVNLLAMFARTEALFEPGPDGAQLKPLALLLAEALETPDDERRFRTLQRLGDVALFVSGFLADGYPRRLVDIDYHIEMGGRAYGALARTSWRGPRRALATVFAELEDKFQPIVDALNDISESAVTRTQRDVLRLYELWQRTGSRRARRLLMRLGIQPLSSGAIAH